jgi:hypothetical protein
MEMTSIAQEKGLSLKWFKDLLQKNFEIKSHMIGHEADDEKSVKVFNRVISVVDDGFACESDIRHAELVVKQMGLEQGKIVITPWVDEPEDPEKDELLDNEHHNKYRSLIARQNFMSHDRMDMQFTSKECARNMSSPNLRDWGKLKRSGRYLKGAPRVVMHYPIQELPSTLVGYLDANWAGDKQTRKSTSGGVLSWSKTQSTVALSSAESELYGLVKCVAEVLRIKSAMERWGIEIKGVIKSDASAALGIIQRQGVGKMRHLDCSYL